MSVEKNFTFQTLKQLAVDILTEFHHTESVLLHCSESEVSEEAIRYVHEAVERIDRMLVECDPIIDAMPDVFVRASSTGLPVAATEWAEPVAVAIQVGAAFCVRCHDRSVRDLLTSYDTPLTAPADVYIRAVAKTKDGRKGRKPPSNKPSQTMIADVVKKRAEGMPKGEVHAYVRDKYALEIEAKKLGEDFPSLVWIQKCCREARRHKRS